MTVTTMNDDSLTAHALHGLSQDAKSLSPKWFYDALGCELFEEITTLPEYYLGRTERAILQARLPAIAAQVPDGAALVELGSGASVKTRLLLDGLPHLWGYVPVDIAEAFLRRTAARLAADYPALTVTPVVADFMAPVPLPDLQGRPVVGFFPGSTLGNLGPDQAIELLGRLRAWPNHHALILGVDLVKAPARLEAAYDDAQGVTAAFNLNLLTRLNREAGADFDLSAFRHRAVWNAAEYRVEMHLQSLRAQTVTVAGRAFAFREGETIHTENSHKFTAERLSEMAGAAGWHLDTVLTDPDGDFAIAILRPSPRG